MSTIIDTPDGIAFARLAALKGALSLQTKGLRLARGFSATSIGKSQYGLTGQAAKQHAIVEQAVNDNLKVRESARAEEAGINFMLILNHLTDEGSKVTLPRVTRMAHQQAPGDSELIGLVEAFARIYLFEAGNIEQVRVVFRG